MFMNDDDASVERKESSQFSQSKRIHCDLRTKREIEMNIRDVLSPLFDACDSSRESSSCDDDNEFIKLVCT